MSDQFRSAISILALIFIGPAMLLTSPKDMEAEWFEVKEEREVLEDE